jgi:signal transduction histidine kinase
MLSPTFVTLLLTAGILLGLTAGAWHYRANQGAELFAILQAVSAAWASVTALGLTLPSGAARIRLWGTTTGLSLLVIVLWLAFILSYTGRHHWLSMGRLGVVSLPLLVGGGLYAVAPTWQPLVGQLAQEQVAAGTVLTASIGPVGSILGAYVYLVFLAGLGIVVKTVFEGSGLFVGQALAFVSGSLVTIVASFLTILGVPVDGYPLTQVALAGQAVLLGYAIFGQQLLRFVPAVTEIGEQAIFEGLNEGLLVVDSDGTVLRANPRARTYLDVSGPTGEPITPVLESMGVTRVDDLPTRFEREGRTFRADVSQIRNWQQEPIGHAMIVREISHIVTREQRLAVLNRILRHNVRNEMNIVLSVGGQLERQDDEDLAAVGGKLRRTSRNLTRVSEKAIEIDRLFEGSATVEQVDLPSAIETVVSPVAADHPRARITTSVNADTVRTDPRILSRVVEEVVANAAEHAGDGPAVDLAVEQAETGIEITVTDDGPGIPQAEVAPITAGKETQLSHTSSFGLWFVSWGVQAVGGTVDIDTTDTGTRVVLTVPHLDDARSEAGVTTPDSPLITE